jgi:hypothetical protein
VRRILLFMAVGVWLASALGLAIAGGPGDNLVRPKPPIKDGSCGSFGTSVEFVTTPSEAAHQAKKEQKLVFVLHVSGHFEDPKFT